MKVVITGGCGFLGQMVAKDILSLRALTLSDGRSAEVDEILLFDQVVPDAVPDWAGDRVRLQAGDISDRDTVFGLMDRPDISVFHFASVVSAGGERDFDLALRVNLEGGRHVLDAARATGACPKVVFTSSLAVYGGETLPDAVGDSTRQTPTTTYGMTKAIGELMINDMTRKGFIDGRTARLPTVIIRPGVPNAAASGFASGLFREPLLGKKHQLPVSDDMSMMVLGYRNCIKGIMAVHEADGADLGADRALGLPNQVFTVAEMCAALKKVADEAGIALGPITPAPDPSVEAIVGSWPKSMDASRALAIGAPADQGLEQIIRDFIEDFVP